MGVPYAEVIGDPVAHSKSPLIHKFWLEKLGIAGDYHAVRVTPQELPAYLASRRDDPDWRGCNVTMPHKEAVIPFLDECSETGQFGTGAVNCVFRKGDRFVGVNTDTAGVGEAVCDVLAREAPICIIGTGGAARAAIVMLDQAGVFQFHLIARDPAKGLTLVQPYQEYGRTFGFEGAGGALAGCMGAINATPLGMHGFPAMPESVLDGLSGLRRRAFVLDMVYAPACTSLLDRAAALHLKTIDGLTMLIAQAAEAFRCFFGASAPREYDAELRELLTS